MTDNIPEDELNTHGEGSSNEVISSGETICDDIVDILKKFGGYIMRLYCKVPGLNQYTDLTRD